MIAGLLVYSAILAGLVYVVSRVGAKRKQVARDDDGWTPSGVCDECGCGPLDHCPPCRESWQRYRAGLDDTGVGKLD